MQKILIVIDMQNDFVTGSLGSEAAQVAAKKMAASILTLVIPLVSLLRQLTRKMQMVSLL